MERSEKKRIIIHAGWHKTGSTAIQDWFFGNASILAKSGIYYPTGPETFLKGHHRVAWGLDRCHPRKTSLFSSIDYIESELEKTNHTLFLSSEDFEFIPDAGVAALRDCLVDCNVMVVIFVRNVVDYINADYQQNVRMQDVRFEHDLASFAFIYDMFSRMDYYRLLKKWFHYFGEENVRIVYYGNSKKSVVDQIIELVEIQDEGTRKSDMASNRSLRPVSVRILQECNRLFEKIHHSNIVNALRETELDSDQQYTLLHEDVFGRFLTRLRPSFEKAERELGLQIDTLLQNTAEGKAELPDEIWKPRFEEIRAQLGI